jgi:hypothetical protein
MATHFLSWLGCLHSRRFCSSLLLPLLLLVAQHGALLHELSHYAAPETQKETDKQHPQIGHCDLCVAFAQVASAATPDAVVPRLLADLSFQQATTIPASGGTSEPPSQRNRGPPTFL